MSNYKSKYLVRESHLMTLSLVIIATICLASAFSYAKTILIPFAFSIFLFFILSSFKTLLCNRYKVPQSLALGIVLFAFLALVLGLSLFVSTSIKSMVDGINTYQDQLVLILQNGIARAQSLGLPIQNVQPDELVKSIPVFNVLKGAGSGILAFISKLFLVFIFVMFMLSGSTGRSDSFGIMREIQLQIEKYLTAKFFISLLTGVLVGLILYLMGLQFAWGFGLFVFMLNFIPTLGSLVATILPLPVALLQYESSFMVVMIILIPGLIQFAIGSILEPRVFGKSLNLHPVVVLFSLLFWGLIWGLAGAFLAVPITAMIKIVLTKVEGAGVVVNWMNSTQDKKSIS